MSQHRYVVAEVEFILLHYNIYTLSYLKAQPKTQSTTWPAINILREIGEMLLSDGDMKSIEPSSSLSFCIVVSAILEKLSKPFSVALLCL